MEFKRPKGFVGSIPRNWIDKRLQTCPFCSGRPEWAIAMNFGLGLNRYHFRCESCRGILSIPVVSVSNTGGIAGMMIAKNASKDLFVESIGTSHSSLILRSEYSVSSLKAATAPAVRRDNKAAPIPPKEFACPNCNGTVTEDDKECPHCHAEFEEV